MKLQFSAFIAFPAQSCTLVSHHRPHRQIRRFGDGWFGRIRWIFPNRGRQDCLQKQGCRTHLTCCVQHTRKAGRLPQEPHPPRRAHDTLQPKDESIIVGYYTSAGSAPRPAGRTNVKGDLRLPQEPHPPRRAHDTLQPKDESIIVGYYTSAGSAPRPAGRTNVKGDLGRETTGLTVPVQETLT